MKITFWKELLKLGLIALIENLSSQSLTKLSRFSFSDFDCLEAEKMDDSRARRTRIL